MGGVKFDINEYEFQSFSGNSDVEGAVDYNFSDLDNETLKVESKEHQEVIMRDRKAADKVNFKISPIVKEHRGIYSQENDEKEKRIQAEIHRRLEILRNEAISQGREEGLKKGREEVFTQLRISVDEKILPFSAMIKDVLEVKSKLVNEQKKEIYELVKNLTKWILLRELKDDGKYIERLLEKLIVELKSKSNLLIQVNQKQFETMPKVLERVKEKIGGIDNVRIEIDYDIDENGIVIESDNCIINGTLDEQFKNLEKLFDQGPENHG